jgi:hypothetical protein|tara:strand:- start:1955 stop:2152 length:198 start_codon:yes stop_codon:yes gene_type:complete
VKQRAYARRPLLGDLVAQDKEHKNRVGDKWGIGTVVGYDSVYIRVYWPKFNLVLSMRREELQLVA